jgi:hypothetical protein
MTKDTQPTKPSAGAIDIAEDYACRWHPTLTLPEINKQWRHIIIEHAEAIERETGVAELSELLEAAKDYVYAAFPDNHYVQNRQRLTTAIAKCERKGSE